jgi:hypothetical protein
VVLLQVTTASIALPLTRQFMRLVDRLSLNWFRPPAAM